MTIGIPLIDVLHFTFVHFHTVLLMMIPDRYSRWCQWHYSDPTHYTPGVQFTIRHFTYDILHSIGQVLTWWYSLMMMVHFAFDTSTDGVVRVWWFCCCLFCDISHWWHIVDTCCSDDTWWWLFLPMPCLHGGDSCCVRYLDDSDTWFYSGRCSAVMSVLHCPTHGDVWWVRCIVWVTYGDTYDVLFTWCHTFD